MPKRLSLWLICSLVLAVAAFVCGTVGWGGIPWIGRFSASSTTSGFLMLSSFVCSFVWLVLLVVALFVHRWRGLWLLIGTPGAMFWPGIVLAVIYLVHVCVANAAAHGGITMCLP